MSTVTHPLQLTRSIHDPIYGLVRLTEEEQHIIQNPVFQRLRNIKQNGLLYNVFPSATHTRFEHSVGALATADAMLSNILLNSEVALTRKRIVRSDARRRGVAFALSDFGSEVLLQLFRITRLAALGHDLGHGPLSHAFDGFAPEIKEVVRIIEEDSRLAPLQPMAGALSKYSEEHGMRGRVAHEVMSCLFLAVALPDGGPSASAITSVSAAILGEQFFEFAEEGFRPWVSLIHDIIASAPADADRMDYVQRDSESCGVNYGKYDRERLLKSLLCYEGGSSESGRARLGIKISGKRAVENFIQARFELFANIYYHKTNRVTELMLKELAEAAAASNIPIINAESLDALTDSYSELGDEVFLFKLKTSSECASNVVMNDLVRNIRERRFWRRVVDADSAPQLMSIVKSAIPAEEQFSKEKVLNAVTASQAYSSLCALVEGTRLHIDVVELKAIKELAKGAKPLFRGEDGLYKVSDALSWSDVSEVIKTLGDREKALTRIYVKSSEDEVVQKLRSAARLNWHGST